LISKFEVSCPSCVCPVRCPFCGLVLEKTIGDKGSGTDAFAAVFKCGSIVEFIKGKNGRFTTTTKQNCKKEM